MPQPKRTPREQLHHKIRNEFSVRIASYYTQNPDRLKDPHHDQGMKALLALMDGVLSIVDMFEIDGLKDNAAEKPDEGK